jgi:hypothetical protein
LGIRRDLWRALTRDTPAFRRTGDWHAVGNDIRDVVTALEHDLTEGSAAALFDPAALLKTGTRMTDIPERFDELSAQFRAASEPMPREHDCD